MTAATLRRAGRSPAVVLSIIVSVIALLLGGATFGAAANAAPRHGADVPGPTIVLVHGAFADASSWHPVIERLARSGHDVIAPTNPLRGLDTDVQYLRDVLASIDGPIVLVGHSYGGFVMTNAAADNPKVQALVYVAAFAPDAGETVGGISASAPGALLGPDTLTVRPYTGADGGQHYEGTITATSYREVFAADVGRRDSWTYAVSQKPADLSILGTPSGAPAWASIPAWTLVATQDRVIPPDAQRAMAARANAVTVEVRASHSVAISRPGVVTDFIERAVESVS